VGEMKYVDGTRRRVMRLARNSLRHHQRASSSSSSITSGDSDAIADDAKVSWLRKSMKTTTTTIPGHHLAKQMPVCDNHFSAVCL